MEFGQQNPQSRWRELCAGAPVVLAFCVCVCVWLFGWGEGLSVCFPYQKKKKKKKKQKNITSEKFWKMYGKNLVQT